MRQSLALTNLRAAAAAIVRRFSSNESGASAAMFAVAVVPAVALVGSAIEYQRFNGLQAELQQAADQAVLQIGSKLPNGSQEAQKALALVAGRAAFGYRPGVTITDNDVDVRQITPGQTWQVTVRAKAPTLASWIYRTSQVSMKATSTATNYGVSSATPLEVALALDNTGSMSNNMDDLKTAAKSLVQTVLNGGGGAARVSIVPYVAAVNPGLTDSTSVANYIDTTALNPWVGNWERYAWLTYRNNCSLYWGPPSGGGGGGGSSGAGSGGSGDARDIFDILKTIRNLAQEVIGVTSAHADVTAATAPYSTSTWRSPQSGYSYTYPTGFGVVGKDMWGQYSTGGCDWLSNPSVVSPYDLFKRIKDQNGGTVSWKGCVEARMTKDEQGWLNNNWGYSYATKDMDVTDDAPTTADARTLFTPYFWPDEPDYSPVNWNYVAPGAYSSTTTKGFHNNYLSDGTIPTTWGWRQFDQIDWDAGRRILKYNGANAAIIQETPDSSGFTYGPNAGCPDSVLRLTSNQGNAISKINGLKYWQSGGTIISEGLMWAWRSLSPNAPYADGAAYGTAGVTKAIVLMTDGINEMIDNGNNASDYNTANVSDYGAYGYLGDTRLSSAVKNPSGGNGVSTYTQLASFYDARLLQACTNIKAKGIKIYTVVFNHAGFLTSAQQTAAANLLQQCASDSNYAFVATNASSLNTAFQTIANSAVAGHLKLIQNP